MKHGRELNCLSVTEAQGYFGDVSRLAPGRDDGCSRQTTFHFCNQLTGNAIHREFTCAPGFHAIVTHSVSIDGLCICLDTSMSGSVH